MLFISLEQYKNAITDYAVHGAWGIWFKKNDKVQASAICQDGCKWIAYVAKITANLPIEEIERPERTLCPPFQRLNVCLDTCQKDFVTCGPFIGVDACHLKGHYGGQLITAVATYLNDQLFSLAFAVVEAETKDLWTWFILKLISDVNAGS